MGYYVTEENIRKFYEKLSEEGKSVETVRKYQRDLSKLTEFLGNAPLTQEAMEAYKQWLIHVKKYKTRSANSFLACANHFCKVMGWEDIRVSAYKLNRSDHYTSSGQLSAEEYEKLAKTAVEQKEPMIALVMQLLSVTDLRVTELAWITVESLEAGNIRVLRGKEMVDIALPEHILADLKKYARRREYKSGMVFRTSRGNPVDRTQLWRQLKGLCADAGVDERKVSFQTIKRPLNREYYAVER